MKSKRSKCRVRLKLSRLETRLATALYLNARASRATATRDVAAIAFGALMVGYRRRLNRQRALDFGDDGARRGCIKARPFEFPARL